MLVAIVIGLIIGLVLGLTGAGGSIFAVPLLTLGLGIEIQSAIGISLGAVFISASLGVLIQIKSGCIRWALAGIFALFGSIIAPFGQWLARYVDESWIALSFGVLVIIISRRMWQQAKKVPEQTAMVRARRSHDTNQMTMEQVITKNSLIVKKHATQVLSIDKIKIIFAALITGLLSGFYGVGGGFLIVPTLMGVLKLTIQQAVGTSLVVIMVISGVGFSSFLLQSNITNRAVIDANVFGLIAVGGLIGMVVGVLLSSRFAGPTLQRFFAITMLLLALAMIIKNVFM